jgi:hypothetical protein
MLQPSQWRAKSTEYAIKADEITDADLRRQYAELAARCLGVANDREFIGISAAMPADRPAVGDEPRSDLGSFRTYRLGIGRISFET